MTSRNISLGWLAVSGTQGDVAIQMKSQPQPTTQEVLAGPVERVTFHNDDSGFCVLRIKARGQRGNDGRGVGVFLGPAKEPMNAQPALS